MEAMGRANISHVHWLELHGVKFSFAMHNRNWNRRCFPFLGCYCQRGESFQSGHQCRVMTDEENVAFYENAKTEWEEIQLHQQEASVEDHIEWCCTHNYGVNNFGCHPSYLPFLTLGMMWVCTCFALLFANTCMF